MPGPSLRRRRNAAPRLLHSSPSLCCCVIHSGIWRDRRCRRSPRSPPSRS
jgi:hypothetical protein